MSILKTLADLGLEADETCLGRFEIYRSLLREWNAKMDLTNVGEAEWDERHFADSLLPLRAIKDVRGSLADVGTGAGFPGLPLSICLPQLQVTLIEAQEKRCAFLRECVSKMELENVTVHCLRAEDAGRGPLREQFDFAVARAVAPLNVLFEYLLPLVRTGGQAVCWKGPKAAEEMPDGRASARLLGGNEPVLLSLDAAWGERCAVVVTKNTPTDAKYPRKNGIPAKRPLKAQ